MNKFILCVDYETTNEATSFADYLRSQGYGWWHRTSNTWVISTRNSLTRNNLRDVASIYFPNRKMLIMDMTTANWAGWGTAQEFEWFNNNWELNH